jgi:ribonucleoside-diphosphate reductase subunit M2
MTDSPIKAPIFTTTENKENDSNVAVPIKGIPDMPEETKEVKPSVAATIKAEEASEPLLQENPQRFVLFPIQNHDVSFSSTRLTRKVDLTSS